MYDKVSPANFTGTKPRYGLPKLFKRAFQMLGFVFRASTSHFRENFFPFVFDVFRLGRSHRSSWVRYALYPRFIKGVSHPKESVEKMLLYSDGHSFSSLIVRYILCFLGTRSSNTNTVMARTRFVATKAKRDSWWVKFRM